jgi:hypothetical protein
MLSKNSSKTSNVLHIYILDEKDDLQKNQWTKSVCLARKDASNSYDTMA